jgi:hypothetical protein
VKVNFFATFVAIPLLDIADVAPSIIFGMNKAVAGCAGKTNPCAGKKATSSVGDPLAK